MAEREVAQRLFAKELNDSILSFATASNDDVSGINYPNLLISPTGLRINRVFVTGVITEVENLISEVGKERELWKARIADPTGVFIVYAGQYQPEASIFLSAIEVPSYVAVVGKVKIYEPEKGSGFISIRPEEINIIDSTIRDRWVIDTAEFTLKRLDLLNEFLSIDKCGKNLIESREIKEIDSKLREDALKAIEFYGTDQKYISDFKKSIHESLLSIKENSYNKIKKTSDAENVILQILEEFDKGKGVQYTFLIEEAKLRGIPEEISDTGLRSLLDKGDCYEPKVGLLKLIK
ncbi:MAG: DNA-binding protein [Methanomethylovorans sp.]|jgi:hypothetical protein|nr:DNA-binding protein [Methanomethylovorans sp.]